MGKINTLYGLPNQPVCFPPRPKHGRREIPGSRFKSFAATKLIPCRRNFLKIQRLPTFSERRINQAKNNPKDFCPCKCLQLWILQRKQAFCAPFIFHPRDDDSIFHLKLQNIRPRLLSKKMPMGEELNSRARVGFFQLQGNGSGCYESIPPQSGSSLIRFFCPTRSPSRALWRGFGPN